VFLRLDHTVGSDAGVVLNLNPADSVDGAVPVGRELGTDREPKLFAMLQPWLIQQNPSSRLVVSLRNR
jgi:hypothetical protein